MVGAAAGWGGGRDLYFEHYVLCSLSILVSHIYIHSFVRILYLFIHSFNFEIETAR